MVSDFFDGKKLNNEIPADLVIVYGATIQAAILTDHNINDLIIEVPHIDAV